MSAGKAPRLADLDVRLAPRLQSERERDALMRQVVSDHASARAGRCTACGEPVTRTRPVCPSVAVARAVLDPTRHPLPGWLAGLAVPGVKAARPARRRGDPGPGALALFELPETTEGRESA